MASAEPQLSSSVFKRGPPWGSASSTPMPGGSAPPSHLAVGPLLDPGQLEALIGPGCAVVSHNPGLLQPWDDSRHRDPLHMLDPLRARITWELHDGCVFWIRDEDDRRWNEGVRSVRSARVAALWTWDPVGHARSAKGGWIAVLSWRGGAAPATDDPDAACLRWAHATCSYVEACTPTESGWFDRVDDCRTSLEERCRAWPADADPADVVPCTRLAARRCGQDEALAQGCWGQGP